MNGSGDWYSLSRRGGVDFYRVDIGEEDDGELYRFGVPQSERVKFQKHPESSSTWGDRILAIGNHLIVHEKVVPIIFSFDVGANTRAYDIEIAREVNASHYKLIAGFEMSPFIHPLAEPERDRFIQPTFEIYQGDCSEVPHHDIVLTRGVTLFVFSERLVSKIGEMGFKNFVFDMVSLDNPQEHRGI